MAVINLTKQAEEILKVAQKYGVEQNFLFLTTFKRYQVQLKILENLENTINSEDTMVTKEYVKGRKNLYTNPAIGEYNKTATAANQTTQTLIKIIKGLGTEDSDLEESEDELLKVLGINK